MKWFLNNRICNIIEIILKCFQKVGYGTKGVLCKKKSSNYVSIMLSPRLCTCVLDRAVLLKRDS